MTQYHVIVASEECAYVWQYRTPVSKLTSLDQSSSSGGHSLRHREGGSRERMFHIDDTGVNEGDTIGRKLTDFDIANVRPTDDPMLHRIQHKVLVDWTGIWYCKSGSEWAFCLGHRRQLPVLFEIFLAHSPSHPSPLSHPTSTDPSLHIATYFARGQHVVRCRPQLLGINCNATRMSIIDINGILTSSILMQRRQQDLREMTRIPFLGAEFAA